MEEGKGNAFLHTDKRRKKYLQGQLQQQRKQGLDMPGDNSSEESEAAASGEVIQPEQDQELGEENEQEQTAQENNQKNGGKVYIKSRSRINYKNAEKRRVM